MRVDVIIPTYKPDDKFDRLLEMLAKQTYKINKIYIMNTEKKYLDESRYAGYDNVDVEHIKKAEFDHGGTRNKAARKSDADIIVFFTQDAVPNNEHLIAKIVEPFKEQENIGAAYGRQLPCEDAGMVEKYTRQFNYPDKDSVKSLADLDRLGIKTYFCSNVCSAYNREVYIRLGGFVTKTIFNEDMIFASKVIKTGYKIAYCSGAEVIHSHNYTNRQQFERNFDLAVSQAQFPEIFSGISSESEGKKLVLSSMKYVIKKGKPFLVFHIVISSVAKYAGYLAGKNYKRLGKSTRIKMSMNKNYWIDN